MQVRYPSESVDRQVALPGCSGSWRLTVEWNGPAGALSLSAAVVASLTHVLPRMDWAMIITLLSAGPACAWIAETRIELRLPRALDDIPEHQKVIKST